MLVSVYVTGLPAPGTPIPWTTPPGTGQIRPYVGFQASEFNVRAASFGSVAWSNLTIPPGMGFQLPPFGAAGHQVFQDVLDIGIGVGFNPPVTQQEFLLWQGTVTVGGSDVSMATETLAPIQSMPQLRGFDVQLQGTVGLNYEHVMAMSEGFGVIHVPAPGGLALLPLAAFVTARRRRTLASWH
ncbi:MAG: hypothetical protein IT437_08440 [Phycisphaerales bacterium]|nr:hypothetical protein [Phycisphaerales bacterium]